MAIAKVAAHPDYTFDGVNQNIPILFAGKTLEKFYASTCMTEIANIDYVGEVKNVGDTVKIRTVPDITIRDYAKGQQLELEHPESPSIEFTVDKAKYFNFAIDDIDVKQFDIAMMDKWADDSAMQMKIEIEEDILGNIYADAATYNKGITAGYKSQNLNLGVSGTPLAVTKTNVLEILVDIDQCLTEYDVPEDGRWIVLPPWMISLLRKSDLKDSSLTGDATSPVRTGNIGSFNYLNIYKNNLVTSGTDGSYTAWNIPFGQKTAFAFVSQLTKVETYRPENGFTDAMKGLNVYGYGTLQEKALGHLYVRRG